jgi:tetratricopeptide (TPR) repeat protein
LRRCEQLLLECSARPLFLPFSYALGRYYEKRGERELALSALDTARKLATNLTQLEWLWRFHALCGHQLLAMKRFDGAVDQYRSGLVLLEHLVGRIPEANRERYMQGREKIALAEGLRTCHEAMVR